MKGLETNQKNISMLFLNKYKNNGNLMS